MASWKLLATVLLVPLVLAACGPDGAEVAMGAEGGPAATTVPPDGAPGAAHNPGDAPSTDDGPGPGPTPADDRSASFVLRVDQGVGAFTLPEVDFAQIPSFLLTADGTLIAPAPQIMRYPGPLLPALQARHLSAGEVDAVVA